MIVINCMRTVTAFSRAVIACERGENCNTSSNNNDNDNNRNNNIIDTNNTNNNNSGDRLLHLGDLGLVKCCGFDFNVGIT